MVLNMARPEACVRHPGQESSRFSMRPVADERRLSITLVTRNRPASLSRALRSIRGQTAQPFEILVGDDSSPDQADGVRAVAEEYGARYVRGPQRGLAANRNHLIGFAEGTHVRTMDDDHEFIDGHLERCAEAICSDPGAVWVLGEWSSYEPGRVYQPSCPGQLTARGVTERPRNPDACWALADGSTIYPRAIFDRGLWLPEMFPFGHAYTEFGSRLHWLGYRIRFLPTTYVIHHYRESVLRRDSVWCGDQSLIAASRLFAALSHSFIYQPTLANRAWAVLECMKEFVRRPRGAAVQSGLTAFRRHRRAVLAYRAAATPASNG
jgi:glycosyltransferase involved in cell wall biosynthesis